MDAVSRSLGIRSSELNETGGRSLLPENWKFGQFVESRYRKYHKSHESYKSHKSHKSHKCRSWNGNCNFLIGTATPDMELM